MSTDTKEAEALNTPEPTCQYDTENPKEYREAVRAQEVLDVLAEGKKGFRQPKKKDVEKAHEVVRNYKRKKADTFLEEYKKITEYYGIEVDLEGFDQVQPRTYKPRLGLVPYKKPEEPKTKKWSEAMKENLATRQNCEHKLHKEGNVCEKCGLNPENWGEGEKGVTKEYQEQIYTKIEAEQKKETEEQKK